MGAILGYTTKPKRRSDVELADPNQENGTGAGFVNFPTTYVARAIDVTIDNTDAVLALVVAINSTLSTKRKTIPVGGVLNINDAEVIQVQIVSGGTWEMGFNLVSL